MAEKLQPDAAGWAWQWGRCYLSGATVDGVHLWILAVLHTCTSQSITLLSQPPDASCFESGLKLTVSTLRW